MSTAHKLLFFGVSVVLLSTIFSLPSRSETYVVGSEMFWNIFFGNFIKYTFFIIIAWISYEAVVSKKDKSKNSDQTSNDEHGEIEEPRIVKDEKHYASQIRKCYSYTNFLELEEEQIHKIVNKYSNLVHIEMDEELTSSVIKELMNERESVKEETVKIEEPIEKAIERPSCSKKNKNLKMIILAACFLLVYSTSILFLILNGVDAWLVRFFNTLRDSPGTIIVDSVINFILISI
jgi:hypothetical protein